MGFTTTALCGGEGGTGEGGEENKVGTIRKVKVS